MSKLREALAPDDAPTHKKADFGVLRRLWAFVVPYQRVAALTLVLSLVCSGLRVVQPLLAMWIIDHEIANRDLQGVFLMSGVLLGAIVLLGLFDILFNYLTQWVGQKAMHDLRSQLFEHVMRLHTAFFDKNPVGRLITRMTSDVNTLNELFATGVVTSLGEFMVLIGILTLMFYHSVPLTLLVLAGAPLMMAVVVLFRKHARKWYLETRRTLATLNTFLQENVAGMRTVQSFNREQRNYGAFSVLNDEYKVAQINTIFSFALFFPAMMLISSLIIAGVIWMGGRSILAHGPDGPISFGELFLFVQCVNMLFQPIRNLSDKYNLLQSAMASSERIFGLLDTKAAITAPEHPAPAPTLRDAIRFEDVHFGYVPGTEVLKGVTFEIKRGQTVAVVGATGAGKTTLSSLLTRFYDVQGGRITIDGVDIREMELAGLRRLYAVVLQEVFLFSGTIAENLRLANPELTDEGIHKILREVRADDFIEGLPGGIQARVAERGITFSTGQKQLLAFARALAADPQVLILDEATANIDTESELRIQKATRNLLAGRTALVIAHRLSTIQRADLIIVMHKGQIHEMGTHEELIEADGLYRRLYEMQYREAAVAD